jgi:hypothetical protein
MKQSSVRNRLFTYVDESLFSYIMMNIQTQRLVVQRSAPHLFTTVVRSVVWFMPVDAMARMDDHGSVSPLYVGERKGISGSKGR